MRSISVPPLIFHFQHSCTIEFSPTTITGVDNIYIAIAKYVVNYVHSLYNISIGIR